MAEHILFLTGKLAEPALQRVLETMPGRQFTYTILQLGVSVAALMTTSLIKRRVLDLFNANKIVVPGRCDVNYIELKAHFSIEVLQGPDELKDLPQFFSTLPCPEKKMHNNIKILAEIINAPLKSIDQLCREAAYYKSQGADIIDIGCLPNANFPHLEDSIINLRELGYQVSVDSVNPRELIRADKAGANFLLSLTEKTAWVAEETTAIPVVIPEAPGQCISLRLAMEKLEKLGKRYIADPILNPISFGCVRSLIEYEKLRRDFPEVPMMMGVGNVTELIDADTLGINALLIGMAAELKVEYVLTTQVSQHACRAIKEISVARDLMCTAVSDGSLPRGYPINLLSLHEKKPYVSEYPEIMELAAAIKDPSFRIQTTESGIHIFNRDGLHTATNPFALLPKLDLKGDVSHAFYLGVELARAQIAWQLGKRFVQDRPLDWGVSEKVTNKNNED